MSGLPFPDPPLSDGVVALRAWYDEDARVKAAWGRDAAGDVLGSCDVRRLDPEDRHWVRSGSCPRSAGVLERLGFRREGLLRCYRPGDGGREDRILYAVLPGELVAPDSATGA